MSLFRVIVLLLTTLPMAVSAPSGGAEPFWIWHAGKQAKAEELHARRKFHVGNRVRTAELLVAKNSPAEFFLNGKPLAVVGGKVDVTSRLRLGRNVLAARMRAEQRRGFIALLVVTLKSGQTQVIPTDREWRTSVLAGAQWTALDFEDAGWKPAAMLAPHGAEPWGRVLSGD